MPDPRGLRNLNPGNIRLSATAWRGEIDGDDPDFCTFDSAENGIRALAKTLLSYYRTHGLKTVRAIINRWAPPNENNTDAYIEAVSASLGVSADKAISIDDPGTLQVLVRAIIRHENGQQPYAPSVVAEGVSRALSA